MFKKKHLFSKNANVIWTQSTHLWSHSSKLNYCKQRL